MGSGRVAPSPGAAAREGFAGAKRLATRRDPGQVPRRKLQNGEGGPHIHPPRFIHIGENWAVSMGLVGIINFGVNLAWQRIPGL